ncbi:CNH domain-containing protein [Morchella snyderi]|nr:CNH domain-containing protein [Morchella snyderi]
MAGYPSSGGQSGNPRAYSAASQDNYLHRTSSFDDGDDATYFDGGTGVSSRLSIRGPEELYYGQTNPLPEPPSKRTSMGPTAAPNSSVNRSQSQGSGYFAVAPGGNGYSQPYSPALQQDTSYQSPSMSNNAPYPTTPGYNGAQQPQSYNPAAYQQPQRQSAGYPNAEYLSQRQISTSGYTPASSGQFSPTTSTYNPSTFNSAPYPTSYRPQVGAVPTHLAQPPFAGYSQYPTRPQYSTTSQSLYGAGPYSPGLPPPPQSAPPHNTYHPPPSPPPPPHPPTSPTYAPASYGSFGSSANQPQNKQYLTRPETHYNSGSDSDMSPSEVNHPLPNPPDRFGALQNPNSFNGYPGSNPLPSPPPPPPPSHGSFHRQPSQQAHGDANGRHPQSRPLPYAPGNGSYVDTGLQQQEHDAAEELYDEVEGELMSMLNPKQSGRRPSQIDTGSADSRPAPLFAPSGGRDSYAHNGVNNGHLGVGASVYDYYSNESDAEAAAGLEMMRLDEMQEHKDAADRSKHLSEQPTPVQQVEEADDDYYDGYLLSGYYGPGKYEEDHNIPVLASNSNSLANRQSTSNEIGRMNSNASAISGISAPPAYDQFAIPDDNLVHPFPEFRGSAKSDLPGTGGLSKPSAHLRKMSFDEGEEDINRSASQSPSKNQSDSDGSYIPELFYHPPPSMSSAQNSPLHTRPLPSPPDYDSFSETGSPGIYSGLPYPDTGSPIHHRNSLGSRPPLSTRQYGAPISADGIGSNIQPQGSGPHFPRSTSLSSHTSTPPTIVPNRSKTDGKAHPTRQLVGNRNSIHSSGGTLGDAEGLTINDLPPIPMTKKFDPKKLSSRDFKKCERPWALSSIKSWLTEMTEGEQDLKEGAVADGIVALFTHFVPTMNVADAETLAIKVVSSMLKEKALVKEEEWVKFGEGEVSGVIYQVTGNGCYAPKLHERESPGRCYAHHCARTLRKITLSQNPDEMIRKAEDWATFWKIKKEQLGEVSRKEIERQNNLHEVVQTEDEYMEHLRILKSLYRDTIANSNPSIIKPSRLEGFIKDVFGAADAVRRVSEEHLLPQLKFRQQEQGPWVVGFSDIFREWIRKAKTAYLAYAAAFPKADMLVRREAERNMIFRQFLDQCRSDPRSRRLDWVTFLKAPITRLQRYSLLLATILKHTVAESDEKDNLTRAIEEIRAVTLECDSKVDEMSKSVALQELGQKLIMRQWDVDLMLGEKGRELVFKGDLQRNGSSRFAWLETHAILFDHYLVLAKTTMQRDVNGGAKHERYDVSRMPIPMDLLVLESTNDDPVMRSAANRLGIGGPTAANKAIVQPANLRQNTGIADLKHSNTNLSALSVSTAPGRLVTTLPDPNNDRVMFPFRIKHLGNPSRSLKADDNTYTLYAPTAGNRQEWCEKIIQAKEKHAAALYTQNAEPFRLKVMADTAFGYETAAASGPNPIVVRGTPLDRAIDEVEKRFQNEPRKPVMCRASVNCATAFTVQFKKEMVAIGTDYGVYTAAADNPREWKRAINILRVTQIAVLEEFSLFLVLADKSLIAYHLDTVVELGDGGVGGDVKQRPPQKLSGGRDVGFFATGRMKERSLVFYKRRDGLNSTFKVLEPVFPKAPEKKSRFSRKGTTEFFRDYGDFYIPTDCYGINLFQSSLAIQTSKGFEVMTLDKKQPWSVPELKASHVNDIAIRLQGQKPLGMFRLSEIEFLLCYEECGVYVNKHGDVSRGVIMEFVGKAKSVAIYGPYILVFDSDFVEIRNAENGRLRQVIAGRDCRCIDDAQSGGSAGTRTIKVAMAHPEVEGRQLVVELLLNEGQRD